MVCEWHKNDSKMIRGVGGHAHDILSCNCECLCSFMFIYSIYSFIHIYSIYSVYNLGFVLQIEIQVSNRSTHTEGDSTGTTEASLTLVLSTLIQNILTFNMQQIQKRTQSTRVVKTSTASPSSIFTLHYPLLVKQGRVQSLCGWGSGQGGSSEALVFFLLIHVDQVTIPSTKIQNVCPQVGRVVSDCPFNLTVLLSSRLMLEGLRSWTARHCCSMSKLHSHCPACDPRPHSDCSTHLERICSMLNVMHSAMLCKSQVTNCNA